MSSGSQIAITGMGVISPSGIGTDAFWASLCARRSAVRDLALFPVPGLPTTFGAEVADFDPKQYVRPRKSLKVMSRDIQMACAAADLACAQAGHHAAPFKPERLGVLFGAEPIPVDVNELVVAFRSCLVGGQFDFELWGKNAMSELFPLWMLKYLPNMPACHIAIAQDARGPNNSMTLGDVSSLLAVAEAVRVIERGHADVIVAGGASSRIAPPLWVRSGVFEYTRRNENPAAASRPFDAGRDGMVAGEGAAAFVLETVRRAESRGATILARVLGFASAFEPTRNGQPLAGTAIRAAILQALDHAGLTPSDVGHVNAHGASTRHDDRIEAQAIRETLGDVPVFAPKSYFGNLGPGGGAVEMVASVLAIAHGLVPPTLNYEHPDPECPVHVVSGEGEPSRRPTALLLNHTPQGQAAALVVGAA
ncbi:MAG: beta-ketoacyl-[acyl-carrier-protein] synthase family protein [Thermoguttaceae bacterium]|nr:beta-ketoacyl-[acyl-carrier-protein] synthase family protein [Thermoguttaceae bacterium]